MRNQPALKQFTARLVTLLPALLVGLALLAGPSAACASGAPSGDGLTVAVSVLPQASLVEAIGGDKVEVLVMVPPGASPHTYEVTPDQMSRLARARLYAKVGSPVEFELAWLDKLTAINRQMPVVDCSTGISLIEMPGAEPAPTGNLEAHTESGIDPHIWLSARNARLMARNICDGLAQADPDNRAFYEDNCARYQAELDALDGELTAGLAGAVNRSFIVFHPSFGYFARDYGLRQIAVEEQGKEPAADYIVRLIKEAKERDIRVVFVSPQYSTRSAEVIAREIGGRVATIDPLARELIPNLRAIGTALREAMR